MLDHDVPAEGVPYTEYMRAKFGAGPTDRFKSMRDHLEKAAPDLGIKFRFEGIPVRPNTLKAHCVMKWAGGQNKSHELSEKLFKAFFDDHKDVGNNDVLAEIAGDVGMDAGLVSELLATGRDVENVQAELMYFRRLGVSGVPFFIYNGTFSVQGGQPAEVHEQALAKAATMPSKDVMQLIPQQV